MAKVKKQRGLADGLSQTLLLTPLLGWALIEWGREHEWTRAKDPSGDSH